MEDKSIHTTSTGKVFQLMDLEGNPIDYENGKEVFTRHLLAGLNVDQMLRSVSKGMMLKRLK